MATLDKIRKRSGLVIGLIGLALVAFVLTDALNSRSSVNNANSSIVGEINGHTIDNAEFSEKMAQLRAADQAYENLSTIALANMVWSDWARNVIMGELYEELGFEITGAELNMHVTDNPNIRQTQAFFNEQGMFDMRVFNEVIGRLESLAATDEQAAEQWRGWLRFEQDVKEQAINFKFNDAVELAMYTPKAIARHNYMYGNVEHEIAFINYPYTSIADDQVEVAEADFKSYYEENKYKFIQESEARDIVFVNFPLEPAERDRKAVRDELVELIQPTTRYNNNTGATDTIPGFATTKNDSAFVMANSTLPYRGGFWRTGQLSGNVDSIMFNAEPGYIYGPYEEAGGYKLTKLQEIAFLPDSVEARHILITFQTQQNPQAPYTQLRAKEVADSLFAYLKENRGEFAEVAKEQSADPGSAAKGGDLGYFGPQQMVPQFGNYCFEHKKGDIGLVMSQFGYHIIEVQNQKGSSKAVKVATVYHEVTMSRETETEIYNRAAQFAAAAAGGDFAGVADSLGLVARPMTELEESADNIIGLNQARPVVKWAYGAVVNRQTGESGVNVGDIELINNDNRAYVVVQLTAIAPEGYKSLDRVREQIRPAVINRVKARTLMERAQADAAGNANLQDVADASEYNVSLQQMRLGVGAITGIGQEPTIVGDMIGSPIAVMQGPAEGQRGVYFWVHNSASEFVDKADYSSDANMATSAIKTRVQAQLFNALIEKSTIEDNRIRFF